MSDRFAAADSVYQGVLAKVAEVKAELEAPEYVALRTRLSKLERELTIAAKDRLLEAARQVTGDPTLDWVSGARSWDCPGSPTGHCLYNLAEDPYEDICLACGAPKERK